MGLYLGVDTSNYTTSVALYDSSNRSVVHSRKLLPVRKGEIGLRQSDAVFAHVKQLAEVAGAVLGGKLYRLDGVGYSARPRDVEGSYMPCFLVGQMLATVLAQQSSAPLYDFSHQAGHVMAALYSAGRMDLVGKEFAAFHFSGGTTEGLLVRPDQERILAIRQVSKTLDLNAGQVIDRVGVMLGLPFPAGKELERLASAYQTPFPIRVKLKGLDCCLSGVENQCRDMLQKGRPREMVARYCLDVICATVKAMAEAVLLEYGEMPLVFAGGVTSNRQVRETVCQWLDSVFATPELSSDNAVGTAVLAYLRRQREGL